MDKELCSGMIGRKISITLFAIGIFLGFIIISGEYGVPLGNREKKDFLVDKESAPDVKGAVSYSWNGEGYEKSSIDAIHEEEPREKTGNKMISSDGDGDGLLEEYLLTGGRLSVRENSREIWVSPEEWHVDDFEIADCDNDKKDEILVSLWKPGNFGTSKPFWVKENDMSVKNHMFVYEYINDSIRLSWGSSNLPYVNEEIAIADVDSDQKNELVVIERKYEDDGIRYVAVWKWNGWGFSNEWRDSGGEYSHLEVIKGHIILYR